MKMLSLRIKIIFFITYLIRTIETFSLFKVTINLIKYQIKVKIRMSAVEIYLLIKLPVNFLV